MAVEIAEMSDIILDSIVNKTFYVYFYHEYCYF